MRRPQVYGITAGVIAMISSGSSEAQENAAKEVYEIRQYSLGAAGDGEALDTYLSGTLAPALKRAGTGPVGLLAPVANSESSDRFVFITYKSANQVAEVVAQLDADETYTAGQQAFEAGGPKNPPYSRVSSELLLAMDCMPAAKMPTSIGTPDSRVYELRVYESATEHLGDLKVEMFNAGEVPIFLDCGIEPVFLGQALISRYAPSLSYLTAYPNDAARLKSWDAFRQHPDWKVLAANPRYQGTVSKIYKFVLRPLPGSDM